MHAGRVNEDELDLDLFDVGSDDLDLLVRVRHVMSSPVVFADTEATLRALAATMGEENVGAVVLLGPDGPSMIVTERDVIEALADGADPDDTWAAEVATIDLVAADPEDALLDVARAMANHNIRHVPVRANGSVVGMVSARDVLRAVSGLSRPRTGS